MWMVKVKDIPECTDIFRTFEEEKENL